MEISPDVIVYWKNEWFQLNATIVFTWLVMLIMVLFSWLATRNLSSGPRISRWQNLLESIVSGMMGQIREVTRHRAAHFLPFLGTLFLFILVSNILVEVPGFQPPTGSLSTTAALAITVFVAVPGYGITERGIRGYLKNYVRPTPIMLPFNIMGEISRTLALAVRLFGNIMSGTMIAAILLALTPFVFPVIMNLLGLLTGVVQAYIFAILAAVYISSGMRAHEQTEKKAQQKEK
ncbi:MAG: F0F1 ATP synthase subunit A [Desulfovibrionales bacterium]